MSEEEDIKEKITQKHSTTPPVRIMTKPPLPVKQTEEKRSYTPIHGQSLSLTTGQIVEKAKTSRIEPLVIVSESYNNTKLIGGLNISGKGIPDPSKVPKLKKNSSIPPELFRTNLPKLRGAPNSMISPIRSYESHLNLGRSFPHLLLNATGELGSPHANIISMKRILKDPQHVTQMKNKAQDNIDLRSRVGFVSHVLNSDKEQSAKVSKISRDISYLDTSNYPHIDPLQFPADLSDAEFFITQHLKSTLHEHTSFMGGANDSLKPIKVGTHFIRPAHLLERELSGMYGTNNIFDDSRSMFLAGQKLLSPHSIYIYIYIRAWNPEY